MSFLKQLCVTLIWHVKLVSGLESPNNNGTLGSYFRYNKSTFTLKPLITLDKGFYRYRCWLN